MVKATPTSKTSRKRQQLSGLIDNRDGCGGLGFDKSGNLIIVVQKHGNGGQFSYDDFRDIVIKFGCIGACSVDGSDSVFLWYNKKFQFKAADDKDES